MPQHIDSDRTKRTGALSIVRAGVLLFVALGTLPLGAQQAPGSKAPSSKEKERAGLSTFSFCWKDTHGRGAGQPLSTKSSDCPAGTVKDPNGLLCYPPCKAGYKMVGPVCWAECPAGFKDTGAHCGKPEAYGRGAGYAWQLGDKPFDSGGQWARCRNDSPQGCEQPGGGITLVYPKCKPNFHPVGTNICSPDCPAGMKDVGAMCEKPSYGNGAGQTLGCAPGLEKSGLLCYSSCGPNSDGVGPLCWDHCPKGWVACGAGCAKDTAACATETTNQVVSVLAAAASIAAEVLTAGAATGIIEASKTGTQSATRTAKAVEQAQSLVSKLNLKEIVAKLPKNGIDSAVVRNVVAQSIKPSRATVAIKTVDAAAASATLIATMVGISNNAQLTEEQKNFQIAQSVLESASLVDPTGIAGVVAAYTKPLCSVVAAPTTK